MISNAFIIYMLLTIHLRSRLVLVYGDIFLGNEI